MENSNNNPKHAKSRTMADLRHAKSLPMHAKSLNEISLIQEPINSKRRKFLEILLWSGGAFLLGLLSRSFKPITKLFSNRGFKLASSSDVNWSASPIGYESSPEQDKRAGPELPAASQGQTDFKNFKIIEKKESMVFIDKRVNKEVLILDWSNEER